MNSTNAASKTLANAARPILYFKAISYSVPTRVFAPPEMAEGYDRVVKALKESKTWGEFRRAIPVSEFEEIETILRDQEEYVFASRLRSGHCLDGTGMD